jgi:exonuclease SbcC
MNIQEIKNKVEQAKGVQIQTETRVKELKNSIEKEENLQKAIEKVQILIQTTAQETQEQLKFHIEDIVNTALDTCFPGEYNFKIDFVIKRGSTEAELYLDKDGERINPMNASGGGVVDIIAFALRISCYSLGKTDNLITLDEPYKFLSKNLRPLAGEVLKQLSEKLGIQIIMVTHDREMVDVADRVFEVTQKRGRSKVEVQ